MEGNFIETESHSNPARHEGAYAGAHYSAILTGYSINPIIDAATGLLGLILRIKDMQTINQSSSLFKQVTADIRTIERKLQNEGFEPGVIVSFRYVLCTFIDEVILGRSWDGDNAWVNESLLVHFHNETWGGEKIYVLLDRLMADPKRYQYLLEFIYLCFSLGFKGRYKLANTNQDEFIQINKKLHKILANRENEIPPIVMHSDHGVSNHFYQLKRKLSRLNIVGILLMSLFLIFIVLSFMLHNQSNDILLQLKQLLK